MNVLEAVDEQLCALALRLVNAVAAQHKVPPLHVALAVTGLCHDHCPDGRQFTTCAYCIRRGNVFGTRMRPDFDVP